MSIDTTSILSTLTLAQEALAKHVQAAQAPAEDEKVLARTKELEGMTKAQLIELVLKAEAPKQTGSVVEPLVRTILEDPTCACLSYKTIAEAIRVGLGTNTSHKSVAWYPSNRPEWTPAQRVKLTLG